MTAEDKEMLTKLQIRAKEAAPIVRKAGNNELADNLLFVCGYVHGLAYRLDRERQQAEDHIAGALV